MVRRLDTQNCAKASPSPGDITFGDYSIGTRYRKATQRAGGSHEHVPFVVILVLVLAQRAGMIMLAGK
jgi:hypothetical protein